MGERRIATINARPEAMTVDLARSAVLTIDMQNNFGSKDGMFDLAGIDISVIRKAIQPTAGVLAAARTSRLLKNSPSASFEGRIIAVVEADFSL